jgi:molecular chaperone DnaJ
MKLKEAFQTLGIPEGSPKEEAKKAFKKLAAKYHPDNQETGDEAAFKKANEAMQCIETGKSSDPGQDSFDGNYSTGWNWAAHTVDLNDLINGVGGRGNRKKKFIAYDITLDQTISFKEAVLGCTKEISYSRDVCCSTCEGSGEKSLHNGCSTCGGKGRIIKQAGLTIIDQTCPACRGRLSYERCTACSAVGKTTIYTSVSVNIPAGVQNNNVLGLGNHGNYAGYIMGSEQYTRLFLKMQVIPQEGLSFDGKTVKTSINISLLESLIGCVKTVPTIDGDKEVIIPEGSKNLTIVIMNNLGRERQEDQEVQVNVQYPDDTKELINFLKGEADAIHDDLPQ